MKKREIAKYIRDNCHDELEAIFDAIENCADTLSGALLADEMDTETIEKAEHLFYTWITNFMETYN